MMFSKIEAEAAMPDFLNQFFVNAVYVSQSCIEKETCCHV